MKRRLRSRCFGFDFDVSKRFNFDRLSNPDFIFGLKLLQIQRGLKPIQASATTEPLRWDDNIDRDIVLEYLDSGYTASWPSSTLSLFTAFLDLAATAFLVATFVVAGVAEFFFCFFFCFGLGSFAFSTKNCTF